MCRCIHVTELNLKHWMYSECLKTTVYSYNFTVDFELKLTPYIEHCDGKWISSPECHAV
jgi:hypothetical protein